MAAPAMAVAVTTIETNKSKQSSWIAVKQSIEQQLNKSIHFRLVFSAQILF